MISEQQALAVSLKINKIDPDLCEDHFVAIKGMSIKSGRGKNKAKNTYIMIAFNNPDTAIKASKTLLKYLSELEMFSLSRIPEIISKSDTGFRTSECITTYSFNKEKAKEEAIELALKGELYFAFGYFGYLEIAKLNTYVVISHEDFSYIFK